MTPEPIAGFETSILGSRRYFDAAQDKNDFDFFGSNPAHWVVSNGALEYTQNTGGNDSIDAGPYALVSGQIVANGCIGTTLSSSDNDKAGVLMDYINEHNY